MGRVPLNDSPLRPALRRSETDSDQRSSATHRGKLPFKVVKTREQQLVNKHVTARHGIHQLSTASLPFSRGETTTPF